ncbi:hypothetical protein C4564_01595 [Candidatus Microgenomates bacterium]|nr:MAG: hypothetical protein C4564_01595 [Candidatus Microgenomates bacterium]
MYAQPKFLATLENTISLILSPAVTAPVFFILLLERQALTTPHFATGVFLLLFVGVLPMLFLLVYLKKKGIISDWDVSNREQRPLLFAICMVLSIIIIAWTWYVHLPELTKYGLVFLTWLVTLTAITNYWKISIHTSSVALIFLFAHNLYGFLLLPALIMVGLVVWARIYGKHHTPLQAIMGVVMATVIFSLAQIFNLI